MRSGRREFLERSALGGLTIVVLGPGCGEPATGVDGGAPRDGAEPRRDGAGATDAGADTDWIVVPPVFAVGGTTVLDLSRTLPPAFVPGGTFGVAPEGSALPAGMELTPTGVLSVGTATEGMTDGVIFTYTEP